MYFDLTKLAESNNLVFIDSSYERNGSMCYRMAFADSIDNGVNMISPEFAFEISANEMKMSFCAYFNNDDINKFIYRKLRKFYNAIPYSLCYENIDEIDFDAFSKKIAKFHDDWLGILPKLKDEARHYWWNSYMQ